MRKYAYLKMPLAVNETDFIFKIMLYETVQGVYLFEYFNSHEMLQCSADLYYDSLDDLYEHSEDFDSAYRKYCRMASGPIIILNSFSKSTTRITGFSFVISRCQHVTSVLYFI